MELRIKEMQNLIEEKKIENLTPGDACELMRLYQLLLKEGKTMEEINKIFNIDPSKSPIAL